MDFHECRYVLPESFTTLAHHVVTADILGDDTFLTFVASTLKVPVGSLNSSHRNQDIKMTIRDRLKLMSIVGLKDFPSGKCFACKGEFIDRELKDLLPCCGRTFHRSCVCDVSVCPYCKEPWASNPCAICGQPLHSSSDRYVYTSLEKRKNTRMQCCSADVHRRCRHKIRRHCPGCGEDLDPDTHTPVPPNYVSFVYRRRETRRNEAKRRKAKK